MHSTSTRRALVTLCFALILEPASAWSPSPLPLPHHLLSSRARAILLGGALSLTLNTQPYSPPPLSLPPAAHAYDATNVDPNDPRRLLLGLREVTFLLDNWEKKTTYCNFGEFQKELLAPDKKKELFQAASKFAILDYDKSETMNIMCKKDPQVVRAFTGLTNDNLLLKNAEKLMKRPEVIDSVDPDSIDAYFQAVEDYTLAVSEVDQLSYAARTDYGSTETFANTAPDAKTATGKIKVQRAVTAAPTSAGAVSGPGDGIGDSATAAPAPTAPAGAAKLTFLDQSRVAVTKLQAALTVIVAALRLS